MNAPFPIRQLSDLATSIEYGVTASASAKDNGTKFLRITDIQDGSVDWQTVPFCEAAPTKLGSARLLDGDIVFARTGATTGKSFLIRSPPNGAVFASYLIRVRPSASVDPAYLAHFFQSKAYWSQIQRKTQGAAQGGVNATSLSEIEIPLPSLDEQRRIAAILDKADALRRKRKRAIELLSGLSESIFWEMFGRVASAPAISIRQKLPTLPDGWRLSLLTDVARLATGHTPDRKVAGYWNGSIPWLSLGDIRALDGRVAFSTAECVTEDGIENSSSVLLPAGTVCFSRTASVGFATVMGRPMGTSQDFVNWVCGPVLNPVYLMWALIASRHELLSLASGSTHRTIYFPTVEQFRVLVPPIACQEEFAKLTQQIASRQRSQQDFESSAAELFSSLQHRAFSGQL